MARKILFATTNIGKIERMKRLCRDLDIEFLTLADISYDIDEPIEDGADVVENAQIKAKYYWEKLEEKMAVIAEDQGTYFVGVEESDNPYKDVKKPVIEKYGQLTPENMIEYYSSLAKKYGGTVPEVWEYGFAIYDGYKLISDKAIADNVRIVETPLHPGAPGFPFSCVCQHFVNGKWQYFAQITTQELEDNFEPPIKGTLVSIFERFVSQDSKSKILFATTNGQKIRLFKLAWEKTSLANKFELLTLKDLPKMELGHIAEDSGTFGGDALLKASAYAKAYGLPTISQDRGFLFEALNWPGTLSKEVMFGDEKKIYTKDSWEDEKMDNLQRAREVLARLDGYENRTMYMLQGLAVALPNGESVAEEKMSKGKASDTVIDGAGGAFDWFFIHDGQNITNSQFESQDKLDCYLAEHYYPITPKIVEFLEKL